MRRLRNALEIALYMSAPMLVVVTAWALVFAAAKFVGLSAFNFNF